MNKNIPEQHSGAESNIEHEVAFQDDQKAIEFFEVCCDRLLNVNHWDQLAGQPSAVFKLFDREGMPLLRNARKDDLFRIDLPVSNAGKFEWVEIEEIETQTSESGNLLTMRVRPTHAPDQSAETVEHFFNPEASSSFVIERNELKVKAGIYGRNEKPNIKNAEGLKDVIRNTAIALGAMIGLSRVQWRKLVEGIIDVPDPIL